MGQFFFFFFNLSLFQGSKGYVWKEGCVCVCMSVCICARLQEKCI